MKTNSSSPQTLYLGLDVYKEETVIAILESDRDAEPRLLAMKSSIRGQLRKGAES